MYPRHIAKITRLIGKRILAGVYDFGFDIHQKLEFCSLRLMKKYAKKHGYTVDTKFWKPEVRLYLREVGDEGILVRD